MAAASSGGEADELIGEVARSEGNEMGDTMATASGGGEASELTGEAEAATTTKTPRSRGSKGRKKHGNQEREERNAKKRGE